MRCARTRSQAAGAAEIGKKQPVPISSRHYNIKNHKLVFAKADDAQTREFMQARFSGWRSR